MFIINIFFANYVLKAEEESSGLINRKTLKQIYESKNENEISNDNNLEQDGSPSQQKDELGNQSIPNYNLKSNTIFEFRQGENQKLLPPLKSNTQALNKPKLDDIFSEDFNATNANDVDLYEKSIIKDDINNYGTVIGGKSRTKERTVKIINENAGYFDKYTPYNNINIFSQGSLSNPAVFIVSGPVNTKSYTNSNNVCSVINKESTNLDCIVYPASNIEEIPDLIRRGKYSDAFDKTGLSADFIIVRDDVYSQYKRQDGYLKGAPQLDLLMYLNGDYFFIFANSMNNYFSFEYVYALKKNKTLNIGYLDNSSKVIFQKIIKSRFPNINYKLEKLPVNNYQQLKEYICYPSKYDLFISFGSSFHPNTSKAINECPSVLNPVTFTDDTLIDIISSNSILSIANVANMYPVTTVINYLDIYIALEQVYQNKLSKKHQKENEKLLKSMKSKNITSEESNEFRNKKENNDDQKFNQIDFSKYSADQEKENNYDNIDSIPDDNVVRDPLLAEKLRKAQELKLKQEQERRSEEQKKAEKERVEKEKERVEKEKDGLNNDASFAGALSNTLKAFRSKPEDELANPDKANQNYYLDQKLVIKETALDTLPGHKPEKYVNPNFTEYKSENITNIKHKGYITNDTSIKTFGIRYVLLASRYTKSDYILNVFDSLVKDFFLLRNDMLTPEVGNFNLADMIIGTSLAQGNNTYHPILQRYPKYLLENKKLTTPEQMVALKIVNSNNINYPNYFYPPFPTKEQTDKIYQKARTTNIKRAELNIIKVYRRDIFNIEEALEKLRDKKPIKNSVLKATGLEYIDAIYDETSVFNQGIKNAPQFNQELNKLINEKKQKDDDKNSQDSTKQSEPVAKKQSS